MNRIKIRLSKVFQAIYRWYVNFYNKNLGKEKYFIEIIGDDVKISDLAVVVHLFYFDNWNMFKNRIKSIEKIEKLDLFITLPVHNKKYIPEIQIDYPNAKFFIVPNLGRDVLPFLKVGRLLSQSGYDYVLKFHSKKSTHREDGQDWLEETLNQIIGSEESISEIIRLLKNPETGVIGPQEFYYPLLVNLNANGVQLNYILEKVLKRKLNIGKKADQYGFFGGTMFWGRVDAIDSLFSFSKYNFQKEAGQIDGTFAHALERAFCLLPELTGRQMYASNFSEVLQQPYMSENIPEWFKEGQ